MKIFFALICLLVLSSCSLKPDGSETELGEEFSQEKLSQTLVEAMAGYPQEKAFRKDDQGYIMFIDRVLKQEAIREIRDLLVTDINEKEIVYLENQRSTGKVEEVHLERRNGEFGQAMLLEQVPKWVALLPAPISNWLSRVYTSVISKIYIGPTSAVAENLFQAANADLKKLMDRRVSTMTSQQVKTQGEATSRFYGLKIIKHKLLTQNCAQFVDCKVNATRIEFNQVITVDGRDQRVHHSYEFSTDVPGIFSLWNEYPYISMESCFSSMIDQDGSSIPYTRCYTVGEFRLGN